MNPDCAPAHCTPMHQLSDAALEQVAAYFRALGEPKRLEILQWLDQRPYNVSELAERCACSAANISRHLALLTRHGLEGMLAVDWIDGRWSEIWPLLVRMSELKARDPALLREAQQLRDRALDTIERRASEAT